MPEDPGYTYDCHRNQMLPWNGYRSRLDRHVPHCFWVILHICSSPYGDVKSDSPKSVHKTED